MLLQFSTQGGAGAGEARIWGLGFGSPTTRSCSVPPGWRVCLCSDSATSGLSLPGDFLKRVPDCIESSLVTPKRVKVVLCWQPRGCR